jgi:hypothetical protein
MIAFGAGATWLDVTAIGVSVMLFPILAGIVLLTHPGVNLDSRLSTFFLWFALIGVLVMGTPPRRIRLAVGVGLYVLLAAAAIAAIVFDTTLFTGFGPFTGVWLALVIAGNVFLFGGVLGGWLLHLRQRRRERLPPQSL